MSSNIPVVGNRVRFTMDYKDAETGDLGTVENVSTSGRHLTDVRLDKGPSVSAFAFRMEVVAAEKPVVGTRYVVTADGAKSGLHHYYDLGEVVECISLDVVSPVYRRHEDAAEFKATTGHGKRQTVRLVDLKVSEPEPEVHSFAPGDRAVVTGTVFHRFGSEMGDHETFPRGTRPKIGDVVTIGNAVSPYPGNLDVNGWALAAECLVPAPKFVPGDRVSVVSTTYVGVYRKTGNVGTVVAMPSRGRLSGISRPDYAVVLDGNGSQPWGYREAELALYVEPAPVEEPLAEWERELLGIEPEAPTLAVGARVKVTGKDFIGQSRDMGRIGTITTGPDADGDFRVRFEPLSTVNYFAPASLALVVEEPVVEEPKAPAFEVGDRVRIVANILPSGRRGGLGDSIVGEEHTVRRVGVERGQAYVLAGWRLAPESFVKVEAPVAEAPVEKAPTFNVGAKVTVGATITGSTDYAGLVGTIDGDMDSDGDYSVEFPSGDWDYFKPAELTLVVDEPVAEEPAVEAKPEDYALRLEVSAKASDILAKSGFHGILGSDVAALADFLLGIAKRAA